MVSLRIDLRLPFQPDHSCRRLENALGRLSAQPGEIWVVALQEYEDQDEWLLLATGSAEKEGVQPEWSFVAVEGSADEMVCTYACALRGVERDPEFVVRSVERLVDARSTLRVATPRRGRA